MRDCCFPSGRNRLCRISFLGYRIISASSPRVAAENASDCEIQSFERPVLAEGLKSILRAGRSESAAGLLEWRYAHLIESDQEYEWCNSDCPDQIFSLIQPLSHRHSVLSLY